MKKITFWIVIILLLGISYRLYLTWGGNFIFNMDNARDFIDVREMVVLHHPRLIGQTSEIMGVYTGPGWYYFLSIPFILTGGNPYGAIIAEIILWAIGGLYLLKMAARFGKLAVVFTCLTWLASNYVLLSTSYSFNPNPILLLTPLYIWALDRYLKTPQVYLSVLIWGLSGFFFTVEMNNSIFYPLVTLAALLICKKYRYFKTLSFWLGPLTYLVFLSPQIIFDIRYHFVMSQAVLNYLKTGGHAGGFNLMLRAQIMLQNFYSVLLPTLMNDKLFTNLILIVTALVVAFRFKQLLKEPIALISGLLILFSYIGFVLLPVEVDAWHLGSVMAAAIIFLGFVVYTFGHKHLFSKTLTFLLVTSYFFFAIGNVSDYLQRSQLPNQDPSAFINELKSIDYVYQHAQGKNFRVYTYLPSVYDYPYQYLFWWYGQKKYGYLPSDYAYLPNKPPYIRNKVLFNTGSNPPDSGLVFLIKQPDDRQRRELWENSFKKLPLVESTKVGPNEVETRAYQSLAF